MDSFSNFQYVSTYFSEIFVRSSVV